MDVTVNLAQILAIAHVSRVAALVLAGLFALAGVAIVVFEAPDR